jgi:hypothetical protein
LNDSKARLRSFVRAITHVALLQSRLLEGKGEQVWPTRRASAELSIFARCCCRELGFIYAMKNPHPRQLRRLCKKSGRSSCAMCFPKLYFGVSPPRVAVV